MVDRKPTYKNRVLVTKEADGTQEYVTWEHADSPITEGTPLNKQNLLSDEAAAAVGLSADATPSEAFKVIGAALGNLTAEVGELQYPNAGAHNAVYRGKALGSSVSEEQYAAIRAGTFDDLYIGDYWTIGGVNYRIAAFDYFLNTGDTKCTDHHVVIVPDDRLYTAVMNSVNTTQGGYVGSDMYKSNLGQAKTTIKSAFGGHVLKHRIYLVNAVANGRASGGAWCDSEVDLMCEQMVYGSGIFSPVSTGDGASIPSSQRVEKSQLPLFAFDSMADIGHGYFLRDVVSQSSYACVGGYGTADYSGAYHSVGVRPYFCIY